MNKFQKIADKLNIAGVAFGILVVVPTWFTELYQYNNIAVSFMLIIYTIQVLMLRMSQNLDT